MNNQHTEEYLTELRDRVKADDETSIIAVQAIYEQVVVKPEKFTHDQRARITLLQAMAVAHKDKNFLEAIAIIKKLIAPDVELLYSKPTLANIYGQLGNYYQFTGNYAEAYRYYSLGISILDTIPNPDLTIKDRTAALLHNLALVHKVNDFREYDIQQGYRCLQLALEVGDRESIGCAYTLLAAYYNCKNDPENTLKYHLLALETNQQHNNKRMLALSLNNLGSYYASIDDFTKAREYFSKCAALIDTEGDHKSLGTLYLHMGEALTREGLYEQALDYLQKAEALLEKVKQQYELNTLYWVMGDLYEKMKNYEQAFNYTRKYQKQQNQYFAFEKVSAIDVAKNNLELEIKERETQLLRKQKEEIQHYAERLEQANADLKQLSYIASHDLREPVRSLHGHLQLIQKRLAHKLDESDSELIDTVKKESLKIYSMVQDLLRQTELEVELPKELLSIEAVAKECMEDIKLKYAHKNPKLQIDTSASVYANLRLLKELLLELMDNGLKFNERNPASLRLFSKEQIGYTLLGLEDNGIGIDAKFLPQLFVIFKKWHTRHEYEGNGTGLAYCRKIIERHKGRIWAETNPTGGSVVYFSFPNTHIHAA